MAGPHCSSVAIIGCGWAGRRHAQALTSLGVPISWVIDTASQKAKNLAAAHGARAAESLEDVLADSEVLAVDICLPHFLHADFAVQALSAGKHVLCEKPLANSLDEADRMIAAAERFERILMVAENVWFDSALIKIRELVQGGAIGAVTFIEITRDVWLDDSDLRERPWFRSRDEAGGGIMLSGGVHDLEKARMLCGEISKICAVEAPKRLVAMEGDDTSAALLVFKSGAIGVLAESFSARLPATHDRSELHSLRIDGSLGSITHKSGDAIVLFSASEDRREGSYSARGRGLLQHGVNPLAIR